MIPRMLAIADEHAGDVLDALETFTLDTGAPCLSRARACFDCEVVRHVDLEADHELFAGRVLRFRLAKPEATLVGRCG